MNIIEQTALIAAQRDAVAQARASVNEEAHRLRPANTARNYLPKQEEFEKYCRERFTNDETPHTVTSEKLLLFLSSQVVGRSRRNKGRKRGVIGDSAPAGPPSGNETDEDDVGDNSEGTEEGAEEDGIAVGAQPEMRNVESLVSYGTVDVALWDQQMG